MIINTLTTSATPPTELSDGHLGSAFLFDKLLIIPKRVSVLTVNIQFNIWTQTNSSLPRWILIAQVSATTTTNSSLGYPAIVDLEKNINNEIFIETPGGAETVAVSTYPSSVNSVFG